MKENDGLSEIICKKCVARLHIAYEFKKKAVDSNDRMRSFISNATKDFQQITGGSAKSRSKSQRGDIQIDSADSYDELDDDMQALIYEHQPDESDYKDLDDDLSTDDTNTAIDKNQELVEILGANNNGVVEFQETNVNNEDIEDNLTAYYFEENPVEDNNDCDYVVDEFEDENTSEMIIAEEANEPQYLEFEENVDLLYEAVSVDICYVT